MTRLIAKPFPIQIADPDGCFDQWLEALELVPSHAAIYRGDGSDPGDHHVSRRNDAHALWYWLEKGTGTARLGDQEPVAFMPGGLIVVPPHQSHEIRPTCDSDIRFIAVGFQSQVYGVVDGLGPLGLAGHYAPLPGSPMGRISKRLVREMAVCGPGWRPVTRGLLLDAIAYLVRHYPKCSCRLAQEHLNPILDQLLPAMRRLDERLDDPGLQIGELAEVVALSEGHFRRQFRLLTGDSPTTFIRRRRVQSACHLLRTTRANVGLVAERCGFADRHFFHSVFKQIIGLTPIAYRRECQEGRR